jgi:hypothetical protein
VAIDLSIFRACPNLAQSRYAKTSDFNPAYNCVAFAAGDLTRWWEGLTPRQRLLLPKGAPVIYWPPGLPLNDDVSTWAAVFESIGYEHCASPDPEEGYEKVAIYGSGGTAEHVARQEPDGSWVSKCGPAEDISHATLDAVAGGTYGSVAAVLRRPIGPAEGDGPRRQPVRAPGARSKSSP